LKSPDSSLCQKIKILKKESISQKILQLVNGDNENAVSSILQLSELLSVDQKKEVIRLLESPLES